MGPLRHTTCWDSTAESTLTSPPFYVGLCQVYSSSIPPPFQSDIQASFSHLTGPETVCVVNTWRYSEQNAHLFTRPSGNSIATLPTATDLDLALHLSNGLIQADSLHTDLLPQLTSASGKAATVIHEEVKKIARHSLCVMAFGKLIPNLAII